MLGPLKLPPFRAQKPMIVTWNTWRKGMNTLLRETEIDGAEMVASTNLLLIGSGVPTKRWGSQLNYTAGATGTTRFVLPVKDANDNIQVISMTDWGLLTKKVGNTYTMVTGTSFASGYNLEGAQLGGKVYLVNSQKALTRYDFSTVSTFVPLTQPTGVAATNISGATGTTTWSWRISALSQMGETIATNGISLATLPNTLSQTMVRVTWSAPSAAAGVITGYNVYRGFSGGEVWVGGTDPSTTRFDDFGIYSTDPTRTAPVVDTTTGPTAKYIIRFQDRLIIAGVAGSPTKVLISGHYPNQERYDWFGGGGSVLIEPDSGEDITGLGVYYRTTTATQTIVVFKERSVWELALDTQTFGNYAILTPTYRLLTASQGCSSHRSIKPVENDIMFMNQRGIYILRYEPQLFNVINANEISAKIRPFFQNLSYADITAASAIYADKKYVVSFPTTNQHISFDRERLAFTGPWVTPFNVNHWATYVDASGMDHWLAASDSSSSVQEFSRNYTDDSGRAIITSFKTKKEDFSDWTLFKTINEVYFNFRNVLGQISVNVYIEDRTGNVVTAKSFTVTGPTALGTSGMGVDAFGTAELGTTSTIPSTAAGELQKKAFIYKTARTMQVEVIITSAQANHEILGIKAIGLPQARGNNPTAWNT